MSAPARALQSGGLGVRDLRRLGKLADLSEHETGRLLEIAGAAGLVGQGAAPPGPAEGQAQSMGLHAAELRLAAHR